VSRVPSTSPTSSRPQESKDHLSRRKKKRAKKKSRRESSSEGTDLAARGGDNEVLGKASESFPSTPEAEKRRRKKRKIHQAPKADDSTATGSILSEESAAVPTGRKAHLSESTSIASETRVKRRKKVRRKRRKVVSSDSSKATEGLPSTESDNTSQQNEASHVLLSSSREEETASGEVAAAITTDEDLIAAETSDIESNIKDPAELQSESITDQKDETKGQGDFSEERISASSPLFPLGEESSQDVCTATEPNDNHDESIPAKDIEALAADSSSDVATEVSKTKEGVSSVAVEETPTAHSLNSTLPEERQSLNTTSHHSLPISAAANGTVSLKESHNKTASGTVSISQSSLDEKESGSLGNQTPEEKDTQECSVPTAATDSQGRGTDDSSTANNDSVHDPPVETLVEQTPLNTLQNQTEPKGNGKGVSIDKLGENDLATFEDEDTDMHISVVTWNLAEESPTEEGTAFIKRFRKFGRDKKGSDFVLISGQECENIKPRRTEGRRSREYRRLMIKMLGSKYVPIAMHMLGGIQFGLFCKRSILEDVEHVSVADVTCGIGNVFHNKGAIGAFVKVRARNQNTEPDENRAGSLKMLFVTAHMSAHVKHFEARDADFWRIVTELEAQAPRGFVPHRSEDSGGLAMLNVMDRIFFCGDLNYRLDLPREFAEHHVAEILRLQGKKGKEEQIDLLRESLLRHDQLKSTISDGRAFPSFAEGKINFAPTFKFDKETDDYDTSHKQRIPAWTDRILFRPALGARVLEYSSVVDARHSDHRPVHGTFRINAMGRLLPKKRELAKTRRKKKATEELGVRRKKSAKKTKRQRPATAKLEDEIV